MAREQQSSPDERPGGVPPGGVPPGGVPPGGVPPGLDPLTFAEPAAFVEPLAFTDPGARARPPVRRLRIPASLLAACAVLLTAGAVVAGVSWHSRALRPGAPAESRPAGTGHSGNSLAGTAGQAAAAARGQAARWVAGQVGGGAVVACDAQMCAALQAAGRPAATLLVLGAGRPAGARILVATAAVRRQLGSRATRYAPAVLARFGSARDRIDIRVVAAGSPAAYRTALRRDQAARRRAGAQLLASHRIGVSARARAALRAGRVDTRLLLLLPALAAARPVRVLAFGDAGPRADPDLPLCSVLLASWAQPSVGQLRYAGWLRGYLRQQHPPYRPRTHTSLVPGGLAVTLEFTQPGPLGLLPGAG